MIPAAKATRRSRRDERRTAEDTPPPVDHASDCVKKLDAIALSVPLAHEPGAVALPVALLLGLALVGLALALGEAELELGACRAR